ncbi:MAG: beta-ketoacyl-[acyl-carrier-protein] synthase family protein [Phycisphaeraceae bacterium]
MTRKRIVITGMGWVTPLGHDIERVWQRLLRGECGITPIGHFDARTFPTTFAAQVKDYDWRPFVKDAAMHEGIGHNTGFALGAAAQAWRSAGLDDSPDLNRERLGIYLGSGEGSLDFENYVAANLGGWDADAKQVQGSAWYQVARQRMSALREIEQEPNMPLSHLAMEFGAQGPAYNCLTACAASTQAIGEAAHILRHGDADVMIAGGAHTMIHPLGVTGFNRLTALSRRNDSCLTAARPFDRTRDGFVLGEGAGMIVLETLEHALARGAAIVAEVVGFGSSADAYRITDIPDDGHGAVASMRQAMADAGLTIHDIDYISAHGTGTKENDSTESQAVKTVFGEHAGKVPMSSVKSMLGHLIAAAGAVELITCVLAIRDRKLPPTINLHEADPACDLDYVPNASRHAKVDVCLSNSFGFGGQNDTLIVRRPTA